MDRIKPNPPDMQAVYGPLDELIVTGCDVHLEQLSEHGFCLILTRGEEEMRVNIFAPGRGRVHARAEIDEGFNSLETAE
jgi:hypothetical protein